MLDFVVTSHNNIMHNLQACPVWYLPQWRQHSHEKSCLTERKRRKFKIHQSKQSNNANCLFLCFFPPHQLRWPWNTKVNFWKRMNISGKVSNTRQEKLCILAYRNNTTDRFVSTKQNLARLNLLTYLFINWSDIKFCPFIKWLSGI